MSRAEQDKKQSPTSDVEEDTEESEYSTEEGGPSDAPLFGNMRTRLRWEADSKTLHLDVRQYAQNRRRLELRYKGRLNTHSGQYQYTAQVQRIMRQNTPSLARIMAAEQGVQLEGEQEIDDTTRFLPAGLSCLLFKDWAVAPGLRLATQGQATPAAAAAPGTGGTAAAAGGEGSAAAAAGAVVPAVGSSGSNGLRYCATLRKQPQVLLRRGVWDSWLEGKVDVEVGSGQSTVGLRGGLRLKVTRLQLTDKQDLQLAVGADYVNSSHSSWGSSSKADGSSGGSLTPYIKLSETSWAVRIARGALSFIYEM